MGQMSVLRPAMVARFSGGRDKPWKKVMKLSNFLRASAHLMKGESCDLYVSHQETK
jgi:hypothetical protein